MAGSEKNNKLAENKVFILYMLYKINKPVKIQNKTSSM